MIDAHVAGTRYNIHVDPADGLLYAASWSSAHVDGCKSRRLVVILAREDPWRSTRYGSTRSKHAGFARLLAKPADAYEKLSAKRSKAVSGSGCGSHCCFDVIDSPGIGNDAALRPIRFLAVSLPVSRSARAAKGRHRCLRAAPLDFAWIA